LPIGSDRILTRPPPAADLGQGLQAAIDADDCSATGSASVEFSKHVARPSSV
jgi:hypothetical protein